MPASHGDSSHLKVDPEVAEAIATGRPVVALESTIITHGMPAPHNVETALAVEAEVRSAGAVPATVAVLDGYLWIGVGLDGIQRLATAQDPVKVSRRDLGYAVMTQVVGGTTVAATMIGAAMAGIGIFATGGIGGVHRGAARSFDISADLEELARTDVAVVCAGVKSILDIGLTLEYLETRGVAVVGYRTDHMPAFYTRDTPFPLDVRLDSPAEIARLLRVHRELGLGGGIVIANPIPEEAALDAEFIDDAITTALGEAGAAGITGKNATPFVLKRLGALTGMASLDANIALVRSNAALAGAIASAGTA